MPTRCVTLVDLLRFRASEHPHRAAYIFFSERAESAVTLTYGQLDLQARSLAAHLQAEGAKDERVLLLLPPGLEYITAFLGCFYAGATAVPAYPTLGRRRRERLEAVAANAEARFALCPSSMMSRLEAFAAASAAQGALRMLSFEACIGHDASDWRPLEPDGKRLGFLQYTSGSTASPRGVMITHQNLMYNEEMICRSMGHSARTSVVSWLPPYHDMGLIGGLLQPLYIGSSCAFMTPADFLRRPMLWLEAITRYRAHTSGAPDFAYRLCVARTTPEERARLDLSHWKIAFIGSEPVREDTINQFAEAFAPAGFCRKAFFPCYGLAEATLMVSAGRTGIDPIIYRPAQLPGRRRGSFVGCGRTLPDQEIIIADPASRTPCGSEQVGEIWVRGPGVALGYWRRPETTKETFQAYLAGSEDGPFLRTGDLGFLKDEELFVTGRLKGLMIFRGQNYYPQDIEWTVAKSHKAVREGHVAAFSVEIEGEERLIIATEIERAIPKKQLPEVICAIREAVASEFELAAQAIVVLDRGGLPKTSSGKIQRHVCRERFLKKSLEVIEVSVLRAPDPLSKPRTFPATPESLAGAALGEKLHLLELALIHFVAQMCKLQPSQIEASQSLVALGMDSLAVIELQHSLEASLGVLLPASLLFEAESLSHCAKAILEELDRSQAQAPISASAKRLSEQPLSYGQQAIWFLHTLAPESGVYTIAQALRIRGPLNVPALRHAFQALIDRHGLLRASFVELGGKPFQRIQDFAPLCLTEADVSDRTETEIKAQLQQEACRPFNLEQAPLLRARLLRKASDDSILLLCLHHIIADGWSLLILIRDMMQLYQAHSGGAGLPLPDLPIQYSDYVKEQQKDLESNLQSQLSYWTSQLANVSMQRLPTEYARHARQSNRGGRVPFAFSQTLTAQLKDLSRQQNVTLFMTLLAAFKILLYDRSQQDDVVVGTDFLNRKSAASRGLVGYLVNQLVLRTKLAGNPTFHDVLSRVRAVTLGAYAHADIPFQQLVAKLKPERNLGQNPFFQVMFTFRNMAIIPHEIAELSLTPVEVDGLPEKFDMTIVLEDAPHALCGSIGYNADLFEASTIRSMARDFELLLGRVVAAPLQTVMALRAHISTGRTSPDSQAMERKPSMLPTSFGSIKPRKIHVSQHSLVEIKSLVPARDKFLMIRPAQDDVDLVDWAKENRDQLASQLQLHGAVLMRGFGVASVPGFEAFARTLCPDLFSENREHSRESVSGHVQTPVFYPPHKKLLWHNENSFNLSWPMKLWFCCLRPADQGGETPLVDSREVFKHLDPGIRDRFAEKQVMYVRSYGDGLGLDWRTVFGTANRTKVEAYCRLNGLEWVWKDGDRLITRCVRPAVVRHPKSGETSWFNQAQHWHPSCLDAEVRQSLLALYSDDDLPRNCFYGDGSIIDDAIMAEILDVYRELEITFSWEAGDVLMLDNVLVAHARNPFAGERKLLVAMGEMQNYAALQ